MKCVLCEAAHEEIWQRIEALAVVRKQILEELHRVLLLLKSEIRLQRYALAVPHEL
jgi:hypothetical protein